MCETSVGTTIFYIQSTSCDYKTEIRTPPRSAALRVSHLRQTQVTLEKLREGETQRGRSGVSLLSLPHDLNLNKQHMLDG